jgi:AraC-like DNA-binding protein
MVQVDRCKVPAAFWRAAVQMGVQPAALLRQARLPASLHLGGQAYATTAAYFALLTGLEALTGDPTLGLRIVREVETAIHPPSSLAAFYARDYRDGLARLARFKRLCMPERLHVDEAGDECGIMAEWPFAESAEPDICVDITFASLVELGRRATGRLIVPRRIELTRAGPLHPAHRDYYGCAIRTGMARNLLVLDRADLDLPFPGHNPEMLAMLTPALGAALEELEAQSSVAQQVMAMVKRSLASGQPSLADVARALGMSERSLQRRITQEGSTFRDLLAQARRDLGRRLLADPANDVEEVACLLGYQDTTSFYRAFREWEGMTPNRWREIHGAGKAVGGA